MRAAAKGWRVVAMAEQLRVGRIAEIVHGEAAVAPRRETEISCAYEMMQRCALAERSGSDLAAGTIHSGQPPATGELRSRRIGHIDNRQSVVDEAFEMHRHVGMAATHPPYPVRAEAGHVQESDFARRGGIGYIEHTQTCGERLLGLH